MSADPAPITAVQPSLRCPVHGDSLLAEPDGHRYVGAFHGERYPIADGIPVLLADPGERRRIIECDWDQAAVAGGALSFYNQTRDHDRYCRDHLGAERENIQLWLHHTDVRGLVYRTRFPDTSGGCRGMTPATIVDPGATVRSRFVRDHRHAASAAARAAAGVRWPSRSMSHSAL